MFAPLLTFLSLVYFVKVELELMPDRLHPNAAGHAILLRCLASSGALGLPRGRARKVRLSGRMQLLLKIRLMESLTSLGIFLDLSSCFCFEMLLCVHSFTLACVLCAASVALLQ